MGPLLPSSHSVDRVRLDVFSRTAWGAVRSGTLVSVYKIGFDWFIRFFEIVEETVGPSVPTPLRNP